MKKLEIKKVNGKVFKTWTYEYWKERRGIDKLRQFEFLIDKYYKEKTGVDRNIYFDFLNFASWCKDNGVVIRHLEYAGKYFEEYLKDRNDEKKDNFKSTVKPTNQII